jgi:hypothetical protein
MSKEKLPEYMTRHKKAADKLKPPAVPAVKGKQKSKERVQNLSARNKNSRGQK